MYNFDHWDFVNSKASIHTHESTDVSYIYIYSLKSSEYQLRIS